MTTWVSEPTRPAAPVHFFVTCLMSSHEKRFSDSDTWLTPPELLAAFPRFDLDPCGHPENATARELICPPRDGLVAEWRGSVWLNPPYSDVRPWLEKLAAHRDGMALLFTRTDTKWFQDIGRMADAVMLLRGRLTFLHREVTARRAGNRGNSPAPSMLLAYGDRCVHMLRASRLDGVMLVHDR